MSENQTGAGQLDAVRMHLEAIRTEAARIDPAVLRTAVLDARERLAHRPEPLRPARGVPGSDDAGCEGLGAVAAAAYDLSETAGDFWEQLGDSASESYARCTGEIGP
jgi:hypothetical protein